MPTRCGRQQAVTSTANRTKGDSNKRGDSGLRRTGHREGLLPAGRRPSERREGEIWGGADPREADLKTHAITFGVIKNYLLSNRLME
jgi:hypothetical protein